MKYQSDSPPQASNQLISVYKQVIDEKKNVKTEEEEQDNISSLATDERWKKMKKIIDEYILHLKNLIDPLSGKPLFSETDTPEIVGFRFLVVSAVISYLSEIKDLPEFYGRRPPKKSTTRGE